MSIAAPVSAEHSACRDLGVAWMNRGHALQQDGQLPDAIAAYEQAIQLMQTLPPGQNPAWANSLGAAWMNHGQLLHRAHGTARAAEALAAFDQADAILRPLVPTLVNRKSKIENPPSPWPHRNLAGTLVNRANLLLDLVQPAAAVTAAREAVTLSLPHERTDPVDADVALKASRAACDALGQLLVAPGADQEALASEASDLVDDALALIRHWSAGGVTAFQPLAERFFRYGTQLYRFHQPHFLAEFIEENLPLTHHSLHAIALAAIDSALADRPRPGTFLTLDDPVSARRVQAWRELEALRTRLAT
jgi:tetratricopeptide (TPR) repeat protein